MIDRLLFYRNVIGGVLMLSRKIESVIEAHLKSGSKKILLIDGARQVGKTYIIRYVGKKMFENYIEINMVEDFEGLKLFEKVKTVEDFYLQVSMIAGDRMKEKEFDFPAILLGDFNLVDGKSAEIEWLEAQDVFPLKRISKTYPATFHNFGKNPDYGTIDYIYATPDVSESAKKVKLWKDECEGIYLSDHYPISVEVKL